MIELGIVMDAEQRAETLKKLDTDHSGAISFEEYVVWFELYDLQTEFDQFDRDHSGSINKCVAFPCHLPSRRVADPEVAVR